MSRLFLGANHASVYAKYRPSTPTQLIDKIIAFLNQKIPLVNSASETSSSIISGTTNELSNSLALDVGCGSGQSTRILAPYFQEVLGTDLSENQLKEARANTETPQHVQFKYSLAEKVPLPNECVHLLTASQCAHWFDLPAFFDEAQRLLVNNGVIAVYGYALPKMTLKDKPNKSKLLGDLIDRYYEELGPFWDERRHFIDTCYRSISLPFRDFIRDESLVTCQTSSLAHYLGYLTTWSAYQTICQTNPERGKALLEKFGVDACGILEESTESDLSKIILTIEIPYFLLMGRK